MEWKDLPPDLLHYLTRFLSFHDSFRLSTVCRKWKKAFESERFWLLQFSYITGIQSNLLSTPAVHEKRASSVSQLALCGFEERCSREALRYLHQNSFRNNSFHPREEAMSTFALWKDRVVSSALTWLAGPLHWWLLVCELYRLKVNRMLFSSSPFLFGVTGGHFRSFLRPRVLLLSVLLNATALLFLFSKRAKPTTTATSLFSLFTFRGMKSLLIYLGVSAIGAISVRSFVPPLPPLLTWPDGKPKQTNEEIVSPPSSQNTVSWKTLVKQIARARSSLLNRNFSLWSVMLEDHRAVAFDPNSNSILFSTVLAQTVQVLKTDLASGISEPLFSLPYQLGRTKQRFFHLGDYGYMITDAYISSSAYPTGFAMLMRWFLPAHRNYFRASHSRFAQQMLVGVSEEMSYARAKLQFEVLCSPPIVAEPPSIASSASSMFLDATLCHNLIALISTDRVILHRIEDGLEDACEKLQSSFVWMRSATALQHSFSEPLSNERISDVAISDSREIVVCLASARAVVLSETGDVLSSFAANYRLPAVRAELSLAPSHVIMRLMCGERRMPANSALIWRRKVNTSASITSSSSPMTSSLLSSSGSGGSGAEILDPRALLLHGDFETRSASPGRLLVVPLWDTYLLGAQYCSNKRILTLRLWELNSSAGGEQIWCQQIYPQQQKLQNSINRNSGTQSQNTYPVLMDRFHNTFTRGTILYADHTKLLFAPTVSHGQVVILDLLASK